VLLHTGGTRSEATGWLNNTLTVDTSSMSNDNEGDYTLNRTEYLDERKLLIHAEWDASRGFDKTIVTLSAGSLALSLVYLERIVHQPACAWVLVLAWALLILALFVVLVACLTSEKAMEIQRDINDQIYTNKTHKGRLANRAAKATEILNRLSLLSFILGVIMLLVFAWLNPPS